MLHYRVSELAHTHFFCAGAADAPSSQSLSSKALPSTDGSSALPPSVPTGPQPVGCSSFTLHGQAAGGVCHQAPGGVGRQQAVCVPKHQAVWSWRSLDSHRAVAG